MADPNHQTTWQMLVSWRVEKEMARGASEEKARAIAEREVLDLFSIPHVGHRSWWFPRGVSCVSEALKIRNEGIRVAQRRGTPLCVILRTFHVKRSRYYEIIGRRTA